jgi:hypothetical protein
VLCYPVFIARARFTGRPVMRVPAVYPADHRCPQRKLCTETRSGSKSTPSRFSPFTIRSASTDDRGGYIHQFSDRDGRVYDRDSKHLVGTCRYVFNFSVGALLDGPDWCLDAAHEVEFL